MLDGVNIAGAELDAELNQHSLLWFWAILARIIIDFLFPLHKTCRYFAAGLIAGDLFAIGMHLAQMNFLNINIGLIALLINFTVAYAISMYLKRKQKAQTAFEEPIACNSIELEETYPKNSVIVD
ncbi:hypothetical protein P4647_21000 [Peribacillus frigoritolerans]|uniref:hypothetical protein n=1 Tax=Peribacillus frigoritolerans TaxID=450367 RepID=UPI002E1A4E9E|nr:hypothetical protein [Peribacillus frigoritolerans]